MNDHDVKDIFHAILDSPRAPVADRETMVTLARRARRARTVAWTSSGAAVVAVVATITTLALPASPHNVDNAADPSPPTASASASASADVTTAPVLPRTETRYATELLAALRALVPASFTLPTEDVFTDTDGTRYRIQSTQLDPPVGPDNNPDGVLASLPRGVIVYTDVYRDGKQAALTLTVRDTAPPADLCGATVEHQGSEDGCHVVTAMNGAKVRVAWRNISDLGRIWYATTYYEHRSLTLQQSPLGLMPRMPSYGPVWDEAAMVEVAANPVLAP